MKSLVDRLFCAEGETRINFGGDLAGDDLEDLLAELHEEVVEAGIDLLVQVFAVRLAVLDGGIDQLSILGLLGGGKDQGGVGRRILRVVFGDGRKVARVADDGLQRGALVNVLRRAAPQRATSWGRHTVPVAFN